jgi:ribosomal-protein-alanine N-acetyltransferase
MEFPVLETERLILRQLTPNDTPDLFEYFSLEEVMEYYDLEAFKSMEDATHHSAFQQ